MNRDKYWAAEYENLRRKKNKEIENMKVKMSKMSAKTLKIIHILKPDLTDKEILELWQLL